MKRLLAGVIGLGIMMPISAMAGQSGPGCGVGAMVFEGKSGLVSHVLAATTNGIFGNQTFGMTFGTLGCDPEEMVSNEYQKEIFVASNMDTLAVEAAQGQGSHLASLAELIGINSEQDRQAFYQTAQAHFDTLFAEENLEAMDVLAALETVMQTNDILVKYTY